VHALQSRKWPDPFDDRIVPAVQPTAGGDFGGEAPEALYASFGILAGVASAESTRACFGEVFGEARKPRSIHR